MEGNLILERSFRDCPIRCQAVKLDYGMQILLIGGTRTHVGAVSTGLPGQKPVTEVLPGHKEHYISEHWAKTLADVLGEPACVVCGIHYDDATGEEIQQILALTQELLSKLTEMLQNELILSGI